VIRTNDMSSSEAVAAGRTEALFREVNERIAETASRFESEDAEFVCECADGSCAHRLTATLTAYEAVRSESTHFLVAPGHDDRRFERVVDRETAFAVVEKVHRVVAETVRRLDPRTA
jgi:hypothetical protein